LFTEDEFVTVLFNGLYIRVHTTCV